MTTRLRQSKPVPSPHRGGPAASGTIELCGFKAGLDQPLFLIAGPCVVESRDLAFDTAGKLQEICARLRLPFIYKSSYDKANRTSIKSFRGMGMDKGLQILDEVRKKLKVPVLTDVHEIEEIADVAAAVDVLQTPAFLCRQTDFICAVAAAGKPVNIKKGQFLAPADMKNVVDKAKSASKQDNILVCERGVSFGYNNLISDMRSLMIMRAAVFRRAAAGPSAAHTGGAPGATPTTRPAIQGRNLFRQRRGHLQH